MSMLQLEVCIRAIYVTSMYVKCQVQPISMTFTGADSRRLLLYIILIIEGY